MRNRGIIFNHRFIEKITELALLIYIVFMIAFEHFQVLSISSSISLYIFILFASIYILVKRKIKINYYFLCMILYGGLLTFSYIYTPSGEAASSYLYRYITTLIITFLVINYVDSSKKFLNIIKGYTFGGALLSIVAFITYGLVIFEDAGSSEYGIRIGGDFGNENEVGLMVAFSFVFALNLIIRKLVKKRAMPIYIVTLFVSLPFSLLTGSKQSLLVIIIGTILTLITSPEKISISSFFKKLIQLFVVLLILYLIINNVDAFWFLNERVNEFFGTITNTNNVSKSDQFRMSMIEDGWAVLADHPMLGSGIYASYSYFNSYSHNNYIEVLMNTGLIGFILYYTPYFISLYLLLKYKFKNETSVKVIAIIILILIMSIEIAGVTYYSRYYQILLAMISSYVSYKITNMKSEYS